MLLRAALAGNGMDDNKARTRSFLKWMPPEVKTFGDLKARLYLTTADLQTGHLYLFGDDPKASLLEAALCSTALPVVWDPELIGGHQYVDGGVVANVPISIALDAKRLADELEELEAVRSAMAVQGDDVASVMRALGLIAAESLSCEVAAVYLAEGERIELVDRGWALGAPAAQVGAALAGVLADGRFPYCVQDAGIVPLPSPLDEEPGIRSYYLLELHGLARGVVLVAHTDAGPRGFTLLCRRLGLRLADVASAQLGVALTQEWCSKEADRLHSEFGKLDAS